jgi:hypothetical protein
MRLRFLIAVALALISSAVFGQTAASATSTVTAKLLTPITLYTTTNMNFGELSMQGAAGGTVALPASTGAPVYTGVNAGGTTSTPTAAVFALGGVGSATCTVGIAPSTVTLTSGRNTMTVGTFTQGVNTGTVGTIPAGGNPTFFVGGTLTVGASQAADTYINNTGFTVTVTYQ